MTWFSKQLITDPWASAGSASPLSATFTGLATASNDYNFQVVPFNIAGDGPVSTISETGESASGTRIPTATQITDALGRVWTLAGGQEVVNGTPVADTGNVVEILYYNHNVYQHTRNSGIDEWWGPSSPSTGGPQIAGDPLGTQSGGPGTGPAFQQPANPQTITGGQKTSAGVDATVNQPGGTGKLILQVKPNFTSGVWRPQDGGLGTYFGGLSAGFIGQGVYLYDADIPRVFSASGLPATNPNNNPINGTRLPITWWTAGSAANGGLQFMIYAEPGETDAPIYAIINDYVGPSRGDTFSATPNVFGQGSFVQTSWGSYYDLSQVGTATAPYGMGWVAFIGYSMTMSQVLSSGF